MSTYQQRINKDVHLDLSSDEDEMTELGYGLLKEKKYKQAALLFQLNLQRFPDSVNAHDSYADALINLAKRDEGKAVKITTKYNNHVDIQYLDTSKTYQEVISEDFRKKS